MSRRGSIVGPLSLIVLGLAALLVETNEVSADAAWDWYLRWWPVLLIAIGVISLAEWWLDRNSPLPRRRQSGWLAVLLTLLALFAHARRDLRRWNTPASRAGVGMMRVWPPDWRPARSICERHGRRHFHG